MVLEGHSKSNAVLQVSTYLLSLLGKVDLLEMGDGDAKFIADFSETCGALVGALGGLDQF